MICVVLQLGREVLDIAAKAIGVGVSTEEIDRVVHEVGVLFYMDFTLYFCF